MSTFGDETGALKGLMSSSRGLKADQHSVKHSGPFKNACDANKDQRGQDTAKAAAYTHLRRRRCCTWYKGPLRFTDPFIGGTSQTKLRASHTHEPCMSFPATGPQSPSQQHDESACVPLHGPRLIEPRLHGLSCGRASVHSVCAGECQFTLQEVSTPGLPGSQRGIRRSGTRRG